MSNRRPQAYRKETLVFTLILLSIWFFVSFGCSILFRDSLDKFTIGNAPLGFWMAQQGSIICFVLILIIYAIGMNKLDKKYSSPKDANTIHSEDTEESSE